MRTQVYKGRDGWKAETVVPLEGDEIKKGERILQLTTYKCTRGLLTSASVAVKTDFGFTFAIYQDYHKSVTLSKSRCTEKNVEVQHQAAVNDLQFLIQEARAFYLNKGATA